MGTYPFKKILIANRGEIAIRIIRACRELNISPIVIFSEADRTSLHVRKADEAYLIGPPPARESYLHIQKIIQIAKKAQVDAVHPGYGFLSENAEFAEAVIKAGIVFIGPSPETIRLMGNKVTARQIMREAGVPTTPGSQTLLKNIEETQSLARKIGYPVLLKAAGGGGGKGMRRVEKARDLEKAFEACQRESEAAFGSNEIYMEKFLHDPHHIEVQILADNEGHVVHLFERECSIQRRYQKLVEETPSPFVDSRLRKKLTETALLAAKAARYINAGTVEFLVDKEKNFYFMEMNTRLQVEHPITEMVTGIDLVKAQIRVASGEKLWFTQKGVANRGVAIECRIYAEDPLNNFLPCPGRVIDLRVPGGPGLRLDTYLYQGYEIPMHYDPLVAKLCVWGSHRKEALERLARALKEFAVMGVRTTNLFHRQIIKNAKFLKGTYNIHFVEQDYSYKKYPETKEFREVALIATAVDAFIKEKKKGREPLKTETSSSWKNYFAARRMHDFRILPWK